MPSPLDSIPTKRRSPLDAIPAKRRSPLDAIPTAPKATIPAEDKDALAAAGRDLGRERQAAVDERVAKKSPPKGRIRKNLEVMDPILQTLPGPTALLRGNIAPIVASHRFAKELPSPDTPAGTVLGDVSQRPLVGALADVAEIVGAGPRIGVTPADKYSPTVKAGATVAADLAKAVATGGALAPATGLGRIALGAATGTGLSLGRSGAEDPTGTAVAALSGGLGGAMAPSTLKQAAGAVVADTAMTVADLVRQRPDVAARVAAGKQTSEDVKFLTVQGLLSAVPSVAGNVGGAVGAKIAGNRALTREARVRGAAEQAELRPLIQAEQKSQGISDADFEEMLRSSVIDEQQVARAEQMRPELLAAIEAERNTQALTDQELDMLMRRAQAEEPPLPRELSTPEELIARQLDRPIPAQHPDTLRREPFAPEVLPELPEPAPRIPIEEWIATGRRPLSPDLLGEPPIQPLSPPMDPTTGAYVPAKPSRPAVGRAGGKRRGGGGAPLPKPGEAIADVAGYLEGIRTRANAEIDRLSESAKRAVLDTHFLPAPLRKMIEYSGANRLAGPEFARLQSMLNGARAADAQTRIYMEDRIRPIFKKATKEQLAQMADLLEDESAPDFLLTAKQREALAEARAMVMPLQQKILDLGIASENVEQAIRDSMGQHFRRFYRVHEDPEVPFRLETRQPELWKAAVQEWADDAGITPDQADGELRRYVRGIAKEAGVPKNQQAGGGKALLQAPFMQRKLEDRPALRAILGEYTHPLDRISKTISDMASQVARAEFQRSLVTAKDQTGRPFSVSREDVAANPVAFKDYVEVPNDARYGEMRGRLMRPEHRDALVDADGATPAGVLGFLQNAYGQAMRPFYISNTALSTGTAGANFVSGAALHSFLSDSWIGNPLNAKYYKQAAEALLDRKGAKAQELFRKGAAAGVFLDEPLNSARLLSFTEAYENGHSLLEPLKRAATDFDKSPGVRHAIRAYNDIDLLFRFASVYKRLDKNIAKGMPYEAAMTEAIKWTNKFHPDYSKVPTALKGFQKLPIAGPFLSYTFEMPRIFVNAIRHNPVKAAALIGGLAAIEAGVPQDERQRELKQRIEPLMTDAEQADIIAGTVDDGKYTYLPLGRIMPWAQFNAQLKNPKLGNYFLSDPGMNALVTAVTGRDVRGVQQIAADAGPLERIGLAGKQLGSAMVPPLTPGIGYEWKRLEQAFGGELDPYGRTQSKKNALLGLTGVRPRDAEFDTMYRFRMNQATAGVVDRMRLAERIIRSPGASDSDLQGAIAVLERNLEKLREKKAQLDDAKAAALELAPNSFTASARKNHEAAKKLFENTERDLRDAIRKARRKMSANNPAGELAGASSP